MRLHTHLLFSLLVLKFSWNFFPSPVFALSLLFFTLLPDIDSPHSWLGRRTRIVSRPLNLLLGHRGLLHSLLFVLPLFLLLLPFPALAFGALFGMCSHLVMDALTKDGVKPFYPLRFRVSGVFRTGKIEEHALSFALLLLLFL